MATEARRLAAAVVAEARRQGWRVQQGRHWKLFAPDGLTIVIIGSTPTTVSSVMKSVGRMRRAGFVWKR